MKIVRISSYFLLAAILSACAVGNGQLGSQTPQAVCANAAAPKQGDWGYLGKFIDHYFISNSGDWLSVTAKADDTLQIFVRKNSHRAGTQTDLIVRRGCAADTYHVTVLNSGALYDDAGNVRFLPDGRMEALDDGLKAVHLLISPGKAEFERSDRRWRNHSVNGSMRRDMYRLPNGKAVPVAYSNASAFQKARAAFPPFGFWETKVGQVFASSNRLLKVDKTEAGELRLSFFTPYGQHIDHFMFRKEPADLNGKLTLAKASAVQFTSANAVHRYDDTLSVHYESNPSLLSKIGTYGNTFLLRGDYILTTGFARPPGVDHEDTSWYPVSIFLPYTKERQLAAQKQFDQDARDRKAAQEAARERRAREEAESDARSQATARAALAGLSAIRDQQLAQRQQQQWQQPSYVPPAQSNRYQAPATTRQAPSNYAAPGKVVTQPQAGSAARSVAPMARAAPMANANRNAAQPQQATKTALAICWQSKTSKWHCDGPTQRTFSAEESIRYALKLAGCSNGAAVGDYQLRHTTVGSIGAQRATVYDCNYSLKPGDTSSRTVNRDVRQWWSGLPSRL